MQINSQQKRFVLSLLLSVVIHVLLYTLIDFAHPEKALAQKQPPQVMDVVLLDPEQAAKTKKPPRDAKTIANKSAQGSSQQAKDDTTRVAKAPAVSKNNTKEPTPEPKKPAPSKALAKSEDKRMKTLTKKGSAQDGEVNDQPSKLKNQKVEKSSVPEKVIPLANLMPSSMALSQLSRDFERERRLKQMLSKEADVPINTREAKYAPYAHALVQALEEQWRPGEADYQKYTDSQRRSMMRITIEHNGELGGVEILRPSPVAQINESAVQAIHAAAPFRPLPGSWGLDRVSFYLTFEVVNDRFVFRTM
ncbi:MAG: hypothetical protein CO186_02405 [Zetaproteobacteria bacterium CG_4_9_14_3_um_filter_49_83]|nr:MAG: hypothetical protein AUJ56_06450 [Zetaproteobacteria bacterium CG1_02_49_23]PIQ33459.1 MAG: hypothetical protein COW62_05170 [Zetaproteobacteria bacterium CG17_big_fil_post_rev_8_21_14_2_50_50_13]PIV30319.1 MAG: hypothetical protein COS35_07305 [Zetaproteobacteria bacterium CG02_land_8_20_14_3_00_50_9]PIY55666.1 MAG: hypothetical protein COZ00_08235 [Zetaproteobacteria bacterium CG_4_10_14_0_8_um_filter_49_80]PJA36016.1 MAG: hypothetical protein CO186_02405 [Zetaproteobacteria bacterium